MFRCNQTSPLGFTFSCRVGSSAGAWFVAIAQTQFASRFTHLCLGGTERWVNLSAVEQIEVVRLLCRQNLQFSQW